MKQLPIDPPKISSDHDALIEKIWINKPEGRLELRIDWDNDRHQAVELKGLNPECIQSALMQASYLVAAERRAGCLRHKYNPITPPDTLAPS